MKKTKDIPNQEKQQLALEVLGSDGFLAINKRILSQHGPELTVYLGNLVDKYKYFADREMLTEDGGFFLLYQDQTEQTGMSEYQLRKCKNKLKKMEVLITQKRGIPPKEFYFLDLDSLVNLLSNIPKKTKAIKTKELKDNTLKNLSDIKETKYKETKYKDTSSSSDEASTPPLLGQDDKKIVPSQFEDFWKAYPRKVDKGKAKTAWLRICGRQNGTRPTWKEVRRAVHRQKKSDRWQEEKFIPHPTTWLNQERWLDDPEQMKSSFNDKPKSKVTIGTGWTGRYDESHKRYLEYEKQKQKEAQS